MPRPKKGRGRPIQRKYPPKTDATVDELVTAFFRAGPDTVIVETREYRCAACNREVYYPEILHRDGRCEDCFSAPAG